MNDQSTNGARSGKSPWHLWVVGILTLLWNGSGAYAILMAQAGRLSDVDAQEAAYYSAQPTWFFIATDVALFLPLAAAVVLLLRGRHAVWLFALSAIAIVLNSAYDVPAGTSLVLADRGWLILTAVITAIAVLQFAYTCTMRNRGVLQ
jgi:hypothetical protein